MRNYSSDIRHRRSIRLKNYDYSLPGAYFITIVTWQRFPLFGEIDGQIMRLNEYGKIIESRLKRTVKHYPRIALDSFVVMPNHVHGILVFKDVGAGSILPSPKPAPVKLSEVIRWFKTFSARHVNKIRNTPGTPVWQRNYYERIIRDENELNAVREYIYNNVSNWSLDNENPSK